MLVAYIYYTRIKFSASNWEYGIGGKHLNNNGTRCTIPIPNFSNFNARDGIYDYNKHTPLCTDIDYKFNFSNLPENLKGKNNLKLLGYPRIEDYTIEQRMDNELLSSTVRSNVIDMDDPNIPNKIKDNIEFTIDVSSSKKHELKMTLKKNETRAREQKELRENIMKRQSSDIKRIDVNVLIIYIDNLSRVNFKNKFPKTVNWLSQFVENDDASHELFQFFRYHSVYFNTRFNNNGLYYGQAGKIKDSTANLFDSFSRNGYITGLFKDGCETHVNTFDTKDIKLHHWDHLNGHIG